MTQGAYDDPAVQGECTCVCEDCGDGIAECACDREPECDCDCGGEPS